MAYNVAKLLTRVPAATIAVPSASPFGMGPSSTTSAFICTAKQAILA
jgi:hypothetical protein